MSKRVLLAGLFHETHTFLDGVTPLEEFAVRRGDEMLATRGDGSPLGGAVEVAEEAGWDVVPVIDLRATPSATVDDAVVNLFWSEFEAAARRESARGIDGICLILHGAMCSQSHPDVEGTIISRIRALPGYAEVPITGVLDLHGNISRLSIELAQGLIAYRNNPHTDACERSRDGARLLDRILTTGKRPVSLWEQIPVVWPPTGVGTADDPMRTLKAMARDIEQQHPEIAAVNVFAGYSFADTPDTGVTFSATTFGDPEVARRELRRLAEWGIANRELGNKLDRNIEDVLPLVRRHIERGETPVVLVEPADNIGGGAPGDGTSLLRVLLANELTNSGVVINDPAAVGVLEHARPGTIVHLAIGGRGSRLAEGPVELDVEFVSKSDGKFDLEDRHSHLASMCGVHIDMGPSAVVRHKGVTILLTSRKTAPFDLGQWTSQGIDPAKLSVIGVKAAVAHRQAYNKIQKASYTVATPGPCATDLRTLPFRKLRRPVFPLDAV